jgi:cobalt-zinc-cadmium efflux system membrane fusion protein
MTEPAELPPPGRLRPYLGPAAAIGLVAAAVAGLLGFSGHLGAPFGRGAGEEPVIRATEISSQARTAKRLHPTESQRTSLTFEPVATQVFREEVTTEGKIAVDEDKATPIYSPYAGRITRLLAKPGELIERGQPLFIVEASDMVQAQNDFIAAMTGMNKARSQLELAHTIAKRHRDLFEGRAVPLKDLQQAETGLTVAQNEMRAAEVALEAARRRLRILGKTEEEIAAFQDTGTINPATPIFAPIGGTIVQRKVGPGQYVGAGAADPVFVIGDMSTVWLVAYVRESDAPKVRVGQTLQFTLLAYPEQLFEARVGYVAAAMDPASHRLLVRATIENFSDALKPEMFANVTIYTGTDNISAAVPRDALVYDGSKVQVWVAGADDTIEAREVKPGLSSGRMVQVKDGLKAGDRIVTKGALFVSRAGAGN